MTILAAVPLVIAAVLLGMAVKHALIGERNLLQSIVCFADGSRHVPVREPMCFRCSYCKATCSDLSDWGYDGWIDTMGTRFDREHTSVERRPRW